VNEFTDHAPARQRSASKAKAIHKMVRVLEERRAVDFYDRAFGLTIADAYRQHKGGVSPNPRKFR
jgi:hypothetical protein